MRTILAFVAVLAATPLTTLAGEVGEYTFTVMRNDNPIGRHYIAIKADGSRIEIDERTDIEVRLAAIPVYKFAFRGRQLWEDGRLVGMNGSTNNNGTFLKVNVRPDGEGYVRTVNDRVDRFDKSRHVFALWNIDTLRHRSFFSVTEDKTLEVSFQYVGRERLAVAGRVLDVDRYAMRGSETRDLWYDRAGHLVKVKLQRRGSEIQFIRDQISLNKVAE
ncbi:MAG TPA: DUF6134 family protein [Alphaproteobacteria bacterium]|nr:DUF6134 family protein [Alphaproteobacteria bacterium]